MTVGAKWLHLYVNAVSTLQQMQFRSEGRKCVPGLATVGHCATDHWMSPHQSPQDNINMFKMDMTVCLNEAYTEKFLFSHTVLDIYVGVSQHLNPIQIVT